MDAALSVSELDIISTLNKEQKQQRMLRFSARVPLNVAVVSG